MAADEPKQITFSYEYGVDIKTGPGDTEEDWQRVRFISEVDPQVESKEIDAATYDDLGADHPIKVGEKPVLSFYIQAHRVASGAFTKEVKALQAACAPDATGEKATVVVRYYDKPASGSPDPDEAYKLKGTVSMQRAAKGNAEIGGWNVTITGQGPREKIANPAPPGVGG